MLVFKGNRSGSSFAPSYGVGRRIAKIWNMDLKPVGHRCGVCGVDCGNIPDLNNHLRNRHKEEWMKMADIGVKEAVA